MSMQGVSYGESLQILHYINAAIIPRGYDKLSRLA